MKLSGRRSNQIAGIFFIIFGLVIAFVLVPTQIAEVADNDMVISPRFFPRVFAIFMAILGALLFLEGCRKKDEGTDEGGFEVTKKGLKLIVITFAFLIGYVILLYFLPYLAITIPILAVLMWIYGQRNIVKIVCVAVGVPLLIYFGFTYGLKLILP